MTIGPSLVTPSLAQVSTSCEHVGGPLSYGLSSATLPPYHPWLSRSPATHPAPVSLGHTASALRAKRPRNRVWEGQRQALRGPGEKGWGPRPGQWQPRPCIPVRGRLFTCLVPAAKCYPCPGSCPGSPRGPGLSTGQHPLGASPKAAALTAGSRRWALGLQPGTHRQPSPGPWEAGVGWGPHSPRPRAGPASRPLGAGGRGDACSHHPASRTGADGRPDQPTQALPGREPGYFCPLTT